jgi:hypothetical protein
MTDSPDPATLTDSELLKAFQRTDGEGAVAEALIAEILKRELDV